MVLTMLTNASHQGCLHDLHWQALDLDQFKARTRQLHPRTQYNPKSETLFVQLQDRPGVRKMVCGDNLILDFASDGTLTGVEVRHVILPIRLPFPSGPAPTPAPDPRPVPTPVLNRAPNP